MIIFQCGNRWIFSSVSLNDDRTREKQIWWHWEEDLWITFHLNCALVHIRFRNCSRVPLVFLFTCCIIKNVSLHLKPCWRETYFRKLPILTSVVSMVRGWKTDGMVTTHSVCYSLMRCWITMRRFFKKKTLRASKISGFFTFHEKW